MLYARTEQQNQSIPRHQKSRNFKAVILKADNSVVKLTVPRYAVKSVILGKPLSNREQLLAEARRQKRLEPANPSIA